MNLFKQSDFHLKTVMMHEGSISRFGLDFAQAAAMIANAKLEKLLGPEVFAHYDNDPAWRFYNDQPSYSHTARLFNIQPIEKKPCEHEPVFNSDGWSKVDEDGITTCRHCGIELKAEWKAVE